ncbi:MAG: hypothetical protein OJJ55_19040 [Rhodococcus sp.]|nr:hypothetical protein [Rhodococcus sp. (in: high G+C Gram-positive bacteria)]
MDRIAEQFKKGWKTSEFWLTILTGGLILVEGTTGLDLDNEGIIALAVSNFGYVAGRSFLKGKRVDALSIQD